MLPSYLISGLAHGPALVLSHSLATDHGMWDAIMPALEEHFRVVRYDARGHGQTPAHNNAFTMDDLVGDVVDLLDKLDILSTSFVGLSMGGMVGMGLALEHPERVSRLVVCDARADAPDTYRAAWDARILKVEKDGFGSLIDPTIERWFTADFLADRSRVALMRTIVARTTAQGYIGCARALQELDYKHRLAKINIPTLYLVGDADAGAPPEEMKAMHALTPGSGFAVIDGAGHLSIVEQPYVAASAILSFLCA